jgi:hypothetical protein
VVAACGLVRDPARAVGEPVWLLPDEAAAELTLTQLLTERVHAQAAAVTWQTRQAAAEAAELRADALTQLSHHSVDELTRLLGDPTAAGVLHHLLDRPGRLGQPGGSDLDLDLAEQVIGWWGTRGSTNRHPTGPAPAQLVDQLRTRHEPLWAGHVRAVLAAQDRIAAGDPRLAALAAGLQAGRLLTRWDLAGLDTAPEQGREQLQAEALAEYTARRQRQVEHDLQTLGWRARRRTDPAALQAGYDAEHLLGCDLCGMLVPRSDPEHGLYDGEPGQVCRYCHTGYLLEHHLAAGVPTLTDRLTALQHRLQTAAR